MTRRRSTITFALVLIASASCHEQPDHAPATVDKAAAAKPSELAPAAAKPAQRPVVAELEPVYQPICTRMLPAELVHAVLPGATVKATSQVSSHAACVLQSNGADAVAVNYDCSVNVRAGGPGAFLGDRDADPSAKDVPGVGFGAYVGSDGVYRVLGNDAPCRLEIGWTAKAPARAVELVTAIVAGCTMAALD